jgi:iron complex transport system substrate-binding protein
VTGLKLGGILALLLFMVASAQVEVLEETDTHRVVTHLLGEARLPVSPERVVAVGYNSFDHLLALGVTPVGMVAPKEAGAYLRDALEGVAAVGAEGADPNLEAVLSLEPDFILMQDYQADFYEPLSRIAPTVVLNYERSWRDVFLEHGLLLGRQKTAAAFLEAFDSEVQETRAALREAVGDESVLILRVREQGNMIYGRASDNLGGLLYTTLGLTPSPLVPEDEQASYISAEVLPEINPGHIFLIVQDEAQLGALEHGALWRGLPAVQGGRVYPLPLWATNTAPLAFREVMREVRAALVGERR